ncbi:MAG TPA: 5-oxoprolinase subunit PxpB [Flavisolibacter sp.]|jgi:inhibitor of KinA|nr:5-oxoprolinase subunit PxpB [Flavisolibacter sp.]
MNPFQPYSIFPLGDSALTIDFGNIISQGINKKVLQLFHHLKSIDDHSIIDLVPAYSSLTVYYDVASFHQAGKTAFESMADILEQLFSKTFDIPEEETNYFEIPVCYSKKFALDIDYLSIQNKLSVQNIIHIHTSKTYKVYMLGFLPGFTYMGEVDYRIEIARKATPVKLFAGAVGIAGKQTGIYPVESPGGWQIIGRTPIKIFKKEDRSPVLFQPGDEVKFYSITEDEFENYQAGRA